jgi:hypothetical protein
MILCQRAQCPCGRPKSWVEYLCRDMNKKPLTFRMRRFKSYYKNQWSLAQIAKQTGYSLTTVRKDLLDAGVQLRSPGGKHLRTGRRAKEVMI